MWAYDLVVFLFIIHISQQQEDCTWLAWNEWSSCTDECGSCGYHIRARTCLTTNTACSCAGEGTEMEFCNLNICRYPRVTCCNNLKVTSYEGRFACLSASTFTGRRITK